VYAKASTSRSGFRSANFNRAVPGLSAQTALLSGEAAPPDPDQGTRATAPGWQRSAAGPAHLRRTRPRIERLLGLLAHRYGARKKPLHPQR
jgi:hypothetical protein